MDISIPSITAQPLYVSSGVNGKPAVHSTTTAQTYGFGSLYSVGTSYDLFAYNTLDSY
jgi:hypothetical protein